MKGVRLISRAIALLLVALAAGTLHASAQQSESASAASAEKFILAQFVPLLGQYDRKLVLGQAECPPAADFTNGKTVNCTLFIDAVPVQVAVIYSGENKTYAFGSASFFEMDRLEMLEQATLLSDYGVKVDVKCGDPRFRLLAIGTVFTCALSGAPTATSVRFRSEANGQYSVFNPDGMKPPQWMTAAIAEHRAGKTTMLDGATVATWIQHFIEANRLTNGEAATPIAVRCPPSVDLTGSNHVTCIANIRDKDLRGDVFVDPVKGLETQSLDALIDLRLAGLSISANMNERRRAAGKTPDAALHCGTGLLVVAPKGTFDCDGTAGDKSLRLEVTVTDVTGAFQYQIVDQK